MFTGFFYSARIIHKEFLLEDYTTNVKYFLNILIHSLVRIY